MELYRRYPVFVTIWALAENFLFAGVIFGWGSLVRILKDEGFYFDLCDRTGIFNQTNAVLQSTTSGTSVPRNISDSIVGSSHMKATEVDSEGCAAQESKLNLWFSIATSAMNLMFAAIAYFQKLIGTRITRVVFVLVVYLAGMLCMAFASPERKQRNLNKVYKAVVQTWKVIHQRQKLPWLLLPGLAGIGIGGITLSCTNMQVSYLHPRLQSTIVALFIGLFDFSAINKQLIRIAYENGISRRTSYIFMSVAFGVSISISTLLFLPKLSIGDEYLEEMVKKRKQSKFKHTDEAQDGQTENQDEPPKSQEQELVEIIDSSDLKISAKLSKPSLCASIFSATCILHTYWTFVHAVRMFTFIGQINVWLENVFDKDEKKVGAMLGVFYYMALAAVGTALFCGFVYDYQRKRYSRCGEIKRVYIPVVLPICLVIFFSTCTTIFSFIENDVTPYFAFILFTFFRTSLYSVAFAFLEEAFPADYFGTLMGILLFVTGIGGLVQYPLFEWYEAYEGSYMHVNIFLLALQVSTIIHPVLLYIKGQRDKGPVTK